MCDVVHGSEIARALTSGRVFGGRGATVVEQSFQAFKKISQEHLSPWVRAGALMEQATKEAATVATLKLYTRTEEEIEAKILAAPTSANGASKRQFNVSSLDTVRNFANEFIPNKGAHIEAKLQVEKEKLENW
ncbi:hypothetical protein Tco_0477349 [Tanacetum coccineum]